MINRDSRGRLYSIVRGEILGFIEDKLLRKHSPRMFSLISERKLGDRRRFKQCLLSYSVGYFEQGSCFHCLGKVYLRNWLFRLCALHLNNYLGTLLEKLK